MPVRNVHRTVKPVSQNKGLSYDGLGGPHVPPIGWLARFEIFSGCSTACPILAVEPAAHVVLIGATDWHALAV